MQLERVNTTLDAVVANLHLEENVLAECLSKAERLADESSPSYWLTLCRIHEAALLSAGYYADRGEFPAAGDLLFNPRETRIHVRGKTSPTTKRRRGSISEQFSIPLADRFSFKMWFGCNAVLEQRKPPLLPQLHEKLRTSGKIEAHYLDDSYVRMQKIADTIVFLMAWGIDGFEALAERKNRCDENTWRFIEKHLCRFETDRFICMGDEAHRILQDRNGSRLFIGKTVDRHLAALPAIMNW